MIREITKQEIIEIIKTLDTRTKTLTVEDFDYVLNMGYAELGTFEHVFYNEEVVDLRPQYDAGELKFAFDIVEDVVFIYDLYLAKYKTDAGLHDMDKDRSKRVVYKDPRYVGRVHVDLTDERENWENVVVKYSFTPQATTEKVYIDQPTLLAMRDAFGCALYNRLGDVQKETQKRASLNRTAKAIVNKIPTDLIIPNEPKEVEGRISNRQIFSGFNMRSM